MQILNFTSFRKFIEFLRLVYAHFDFSWHFIVFQGNKIQFCIIISSIISFQEPCLKSVTILIAY